MRFLNETTARAATNVYGRNPSGCVSTVAFIIGITSALCFFRYWKWEFLIVPVLLITVTFWHQRNLQRR